MVSLPNGRSLLIRLGAVGFAGALAFGSASALAKHEALEFPVAIHTGSCEEPGDVVTDLGVLVRLPEDAPDEGEPVGAPGAQVVHGLPGDAELDLSVEDLFADDHILAVFDPEGETIIACGPIGAYTFEDGTDLAFGLRSQGDSPYSGVVLIDNDDDEDNDVIEIYLVNDTPASASTPAS